MIRIGLVALISLTINNSSPTNSASNRPPVAEAIFSYSLPSNRHHPAFVYTKDRVVLNGSCSYDPDGNHVMGSCSYDSNNPDGSRIRRVWSMYKVPEGSSLTDSDIIGRLGSYPIFSPDVAGEYILELKVTDEMGASAIDYITVSAKDSIPVKLKASPAHNHQKTEDNNKKGIFKPIKNWIRNKRK